MTTPHADRAAPATPLTPRSEAMMPDPRPVPPEVVEALLHSIAMYRYELPENCQHPLDEREAGVALTAALSAFLAAPSRGPWKAERGAYLGPDLWSVWRFVPMTRPEDAGQMQRHGPFTEPKAVAVCAALNHLAAGGGDG